MSMNGRGGVRRHLLAGAALAASLPLPAVAQETAPPPPAPAPAPAQPTSPTDPDIAPAPSGRRTYAPADFARFAPRTALDMLQRVPGFVIREAEGERGLGTATGNVVLNGQRISGKSDSVVTQLGRIPAGNVVRIEIVDGATLDIPGLSGQVANIVARAGGISGQFSWNPEFRTNFTDPLYTRFSLSAAGRAGPVEYTLALENQASRGGAGGPTLIFNPDGTVRERFDDIFTSNFDQPKGSARFVIHGPGDAVGNLNLLYREYWYDYRENGVRTPAGGISRDRNVLDEQDGHNYEVSGDYEFPLIGGRLKLIGNQSYGHGITSSRVITSFRSGAARVGDLYVNEHGSLERIGRAEFRFRGLGGDWQVSGEAAFNSLDTASRLFSLDAGGTFVDMPFPGAQARVEEARYEGIVSYSRRLGPTLTAQIGAGAEQSTLSQAGAGGLTRRFVRPKGQLTVAWTPDARATVNLRLRRRVGQIDFGDFVASVDLQNGNENAGNPDLVPPQSWDAEVEGVRRFGPWGSATVRAYYHKIQDIIDIVPIGAAGQGIGNVDAARRWGMEAKGTVTFDPAGWRGARLDLRAWLQHSEVRDPLTHVLRPISGELHRYFEATLRYDIPGGSWAAGSAASYGDDTYVYRLTEYRSAQDGPVLWSVYVENKDVFGLTIRATAANIADARQVRTRTVFDGFRTGPVSFTERRDRLIGPVFALQVRGRF